MTQGRNFRGALGIGKTDSELGRSTVPVEVNASGRYDKTNAVAVGVGRYHTMIILNDGTAMGFGNNDTNQLGLSSQDPNQNTEPVEVFIRSNYPGGYNRNAISVSCSNDVTRTNPRTTDNTNSFTVLLLNTGKLIFFGYINYEIDSGGNYINTGYIPVRTLDSNIQPTIGEYHYGDYYAVDVKCAGESGLVLLNSGQVLVFGYNQNTLGVRPEDKNTGGSSDTTGTQFMFPLRTDTSSYDGTNAVSIACAYNVNAVLLDTGKIVTFGKKQRHTGYPDAGDYEGDTLPPTDMPLQGGYDGTNAKSICLGISHGLILLNDNSVISSVIKTNSVENSYGEGGRNITNGDDRNYAAIDSSVFPSAVNNIFSADYVSYFLLENGELYGCGRNDYNNVSQFNSSAIETPKSIITQETSESYDKTNIIVFNQITKYTYLNIKKFLINNKFTVDYAIKNKNTIENISNEFNFRDFENTTEINFSNLNFKDSIYIYSSSHNESVESLKSATAGNSNIYLDCNNYNTSLFSGSGSSNGIIWKTNFSGYTKISAAIKFVPTANYFRGDIVFYTSDEESTSAIVQERFRIKKDGDVIFTGTLNGATINSSGINGAYINSSGINGATIINNNISCYNISCNDLDLVGAINSINNRDLLIAGRVLIGSTSATMQGAVQIENSVDNGTTKVGSYFLNGGSFNHLSGSYLEKADTNGRIHVGLRVKRGIWCYQLNYDSDMRIKENIRDVSDNFALQKLRDISCVNYEYKDKINRGFSETIGFIAQQVKEHMPIAIAIQKEIIPNEMRVIENPVWNIVHPTDVSDNKIYKLTINDLNDTSGNILYRFYVSNDISGNDECKKEIYSLEDDPKSFLFDQSWNNVFLYGKKVDDFHTLDKQKLFSLNFSATQEIDRIQQKQVLDIESLKVENMQLKTEVATLKTQMENILSRLSELESK
jgi:alpha-tubulin suppressor-like RCC1 family protein